MQEIKDCPEDWCKEDDNYLKTLVSIHGSHDWNVIASNMDLALRPKHYTNQECRERWYNYLDPAIIKRPWTDYEDYKLLCAHKKNQNRWADVAQILDGRTGNSIKNRFYSIFRKVKNKIKENDFVHPNKFELLRILYIISLMEYYFKHPVSTTENKGNRGKNFIYTLIHDLHEDEVTIYKSKIQEKEGKEIKIDELWAEVSRTMSGTSSRHSANAETVYHDERPSKLLKKPPTQWLLPQPRFIDHPEPLSQDEKEAFQMHAFQRKDPSSAGPYACQPMIMSPPVYQASPFSAMNYMPSRGSNLYGGFSEFTSTISTPCSVGFANPNIQLVGYTNPLWTIVGTAPSPYQTDQTPQSTTFINPCVFR